MINMIKAEMYRASKNISIYIAIGLMLLMIAISIYTVSPGNIGVNSGGSTTANAISEMDKTQLSNLSIGKLRDFMLDQENYKLDREVLGNNIIMYYVFIFIAAVIIAVDFSSGSVKNTLTSAISRRKYFYSKLITVLLICTIFLFINNYLMYFLNVVFNGSKLSSGLWWVTKNTFLQLPPVFALVSILVGIAFMARKTAVFNMITIPLLVVWQMIFGLLTILFKLPQKIAGYDLSVMFRKLANEPSNDYIASSYIVCIVIIVLFLACGYFSFKKTEIR